MPIQQALDDFNIKTDQCKRLIESAHKVDSNNQFLFSAIDREQITAAAFLNLFIAWEAYLEAATYAYLTGAHTLKGIIPVKYASPATPQAAFEMLKGTQRYFDFGNHHLFKQIVKIFFENGYPFEQCLSQINTDLEDIRVLRNATAHITSNTQTQLEGLANRIFGTPRPHIGLYNFLVSQDPRSGTQDTVFSRYAEVLSVTAELIAKG